MGHAEPDFLAGLDLRPVSLNRSPGLLLKGLALGKGPSALEVVVAYSQLMPPRDTVLSAWKERQGGRAAPVLLVVLWGKSAAVCGPAGEEPPIYTDLDAGQIERLCREALDQPDRHAALRSLRDSLQAVGSLLGGIRNEGFLATHELRTGARSRSDWSSALDKAKRVLSLRGEDLLRGLGFDIQRCDRVTAILRAGNRRAALAVLLNRDESPELQAARFGDQSPISYAFTVAVRENVDYVVVLHGAKVRIYPTDIGKGVGRRGRTETYVECHAGLLRDDDAAYLWLLCSSDALAKDGTLEQLVESSSRYSGELADRLRERVYQSVVPRLAQGVIAARNLRNPTAQDLAETYEMTLTVLFRLLFIAYAEDKDLLPYRGNELYRRRSLKTKAQEMLDLTRTGTVHDASDALWAEVRSLFHAVDKGNTEWGVPPYNGGLFSSDPAVSRVGALLDKLTIPNTSVGPALHDLLLVETPEGLGPVDFRSLTVREFGTIYEGLLESELSVAETDLAVDKDGFYRPRRKNEPAIVAAGQVYLHNASGARKSSGSYFTKTFAVEHLLQRSLVPALTEHLARLDAMKDDNEAAETFFDFRVADIAMGSAHFLVSAVDHIEKAFSDYLSRRPLPGVRAELASLRQAATKGLGPLADTVEIEDAQLLRRLIARRCIYGVDINPTAVQLARLAIWIHTFVPGLPLSLLDHNLVVGNSLVGIARLAEVKEKAEEVGVPLFPIDAEHMLGDSLSHLRRLALIADATLDDIEKARSAQKKALDTVAPARALCDIVTAYRIADELLPVDVGKWETLKASIAGSREHKKAREMLGAMEPFHFPIAFPEVFLRDRPGFDVIVGNPPWEEAMSDEDAFWARHSPGLHGLSQKDKEAAMAKLRHERPDLVEHHAKELAEVESLRHALTMGQFPGMGTGDADLYKAFCWRFWHLLRGAGGYLGVVLPRAAMQAKGSTEFRRTLFLQTGSVDITMLLNNRQWFFDDVHPQYTIALLALYKCSSTQTSVSLRGPFASMERYTVGSCCEPAEFSGEAVVGWNDTASLPLLPTEESVEVFGQLRKSPRLDMDDGRSWRARPYSELHATNDKPLMDLTSQKRPRGFWPVFKGESFDIWEPDTGTYYAWSDPKVLLPILQKKRLHAAKNSRSAFSEFTRAAIRDEKTLPCVSPRIAFRQVARATDTRTLRVALLPPNVFVTNHGPYFLWPRGSERDAAYLLGVLSSITLDWYARRFVEVNMSLFILNAFPVPRPAGENALRVRVVELAGRLACPDERFADWAKAVGVERGPLAEDDKQDKIHELDAVVAHLYGLKERQLAHIFETFHEGWDHEARLKDTLKHYREWQKRL